MIPLAIFDDLRAQLVWPATNATPTAINLREPTSESVRQAAASLIRYFDFLKKNSNACGDADAARWHTDHTFCGGDRIRARDLKRRAAPSRGTQQGEASPATAAEARNETETNQRIASSRLDISAGGRQNGEEAQAAAHRWARLQCGGATMAVAGGGGRKN
jgi:hypothetical protein